MPSLLTAANSGAGRTLSRVTSFSRDWGDDEPSQHPSSSAVPWSPSPPRVKRKLPSFSAPARPSCSSTGDGDDNLTPQERRRKAIMEAMGGGSSSSSSAPTSAPSRSSAPARVTVPLRPLRASNSTILPSSRINVDAEAPDSLPELPSLDVKKRPKPWESNFTTAKKVQETGGGMSRTNSSSSIGSGNKKSKAYPTINIRNKLVLSSEQQAVLKMVVDEGRNIFFTGSAGAGKSVLLREIIRSLNLKHARSKDAVAVTASTGIAACNIGGVTLHSFGGMGLATEEPAELVRKLKRNKKAATRWVRTKVLIIDEISMVEADLFDKYNKVAQLMRKRPGQPFGGIQLICTGDFFQLPPVTKSGEPRFCFEAATWEECIRTQVNLTKVFRQKDTRFVNMLNEMRFGKLTAESIRTFQSLDRPIPCPDGIVPTELFPRREDVDRSNMTRLKNLNTDGYSYPAQDGGSIQDAKQREKMLANFMAAQHLEIKVDAQVMLIKNIDETLVNGSMGRVIGFCHKGSFITDPRTDKWRPTGYEEDIETNAGGDEEVKTKMLAKFRSQVNFSTKPFPVVRFSIPGGGTRDMFVEYDSFKTELPNGEVQVSRLQLPLILAWAMSIHKAQGQTLERVKVDLSKVFEKGQAYVALSRATSLEGLQVKGFRAEKVMAHRKVAVWSDRLQSLNV